MKQVQVILCLFLLSFCSCGVGSKPDNKVFVGTWENASGAKLQLNSDMTFTAKSLPVSLFFNDKYDTSKREYFNGSGHWRIKEWKFQFPTISIDFDSTNISKLCASELYVSGDGFWEYHAPWNTIFMWIGEEGGERYEFIRQP